jgi:hypothetical protein
MECITKEKKHKKIIIWVLDGVPKFNQIEFYNLELSSNFNLQITWNRPIKNLTNNTLSIKFSHSNVFFQEKTISVNQFRIQYNEVINDIISNMNQKLLIQGFTFKMEKIYIKKISKYISKIFKYIKKKEKKNKNNNNIFHTI